LTITDISHEDLRDLAAALTRQAGAWLASRRLSDLGTATKSSLPYLEIVMGREAERLVLDDLAERRPDDAVIVNKNYSRTGNSRVRWILNPLDGTVNYTYGLSSYGVSLAAEVDGVVVAGAVYSALFGTVFDAVLGGGARADGDLVTCTGATDLALSLIATGFSDSADQRARQGRAIAELLPDVGNLRLFGPATMDLCAVAAGHLDAFFEMDLEPWECVAGLLIAAEAGARTGTVPTPHGEVVVAAAPGVYERLVAELQRLFD
jgi:myo-inositol-1(or 4)-monophosphatase